MKKTYISLMALLSLGLVVTSCSNDDEGAVNSVQIAGTHIKTFTITQEGTGVTRTAIDPIIDGAPASITGYKIEWQEGDKVTIYDGASTDPKKVGTISQIVATDKSKATIESPVADGATKFTAVYPQSVGAGCTISDNNITGLVIPDAQTATLNSYDPAAAIMTAYLDQTDYNYGTGTGQTVRADELNFKNVCAFLKLTTNKAYNSIKVSVATGSIAGTYSVSDAGTSPTLYATTEGKEVTLSLSSGTIAAGTYYIAVAPGTVSGLKIECATSAGIDTYNPSSTTVLNRNTVYEVGELGYGVSVDEPIINFGGTDKNTAVVTFTGLKNSGATLTVTPTDGSATLSATTVSSTANTVTVTAAKKGTANIGLGDAQTSIEVTNFNAKIFNAETDGTEQNENSALTTVYLRVYDATDIIGNTSPVKYTVTGASLATTSTPGVWEVTCGTGGYKDAKLKVTYEYKGVVFTLLDKQ